MKHVMAFDESKGKSMMTIYDKYKQCEFEGEITHTRSDFDQLHQRLLELEQLDGQAPEIFLRRRVFIQKG